MRFRRKPTRVNETPTARLVCADAPKTRHRPAPLDPEHRRQVSFVLEVVDLLAARYGFDPATLVSPRTGAPLGPELARMREALQDSPDAPREDGSRAG
jgi:hypothetical protein